MARRTAAPSAPWTFAHRRSFGPSSRNTSPPRRRSASQALVERYGLGVSSATVRSILAELEAAGLLTHPHTSAGRVPTDAGYRFYVESIVDAVPLPAVEQLMIRHQFGQVEFASEHWFRLAATTLARITRSAGLATPAKPRAAHIRRVDLVAINERMASLILVLREGAIKQALVNLADDDRSTSRRSTGVAALLNERLADMTAAPGRGDRRAARARRPRRGPRRAGSASGSSASSREYDARGDRGGLQRRPAQRHGRPEFAQSDKLRRVFSALENRAYLGELVGSVAGAGRDPGLHRPRERADRDARRVAGPRAVRAARPGDRRRRRPRPDPDGLFPGDRHGPVRVRSDERTGGSPLCLNDDGRARSERADEIDISPTKLLAEIEKLKGELDAARTGSEEYVGALQRERAEFQNFRRRTSEERLRDARARRRGPASARCSPWPTTSTGRSTRGRDDRRRPMVRGIAAIDASCACCSRARASARSTRRRASRSTRASTRRSRRVPGTGRAEGEIVEEVRRGYRLRDRALRPALVAVAGPADDLNNDDGHGGGGDGRSLQGSAAVLSIVRVLISDPSRSLGLLLGVGLALCLPGSLVDDRVLGPPLTPCGIANLLSVVVLGFLPAGEELETGRIRPRVVGP